MKLSISVVVLSLALGGAATAQDQRIRIGDLDLSDPFQASQFDRRVKNAARRMCSGGTPLDAQRCIDGVREEAMRLLPSASRDDYVRARNGERLRVQAPAVVG